MPIKDKERWARLAALGAKSEIPTPEGEAKMSDVIIQLADPLIRKHGTSAERIETIVMLSIAAWNKSMFPTDKQSIVENDLIDCFVPKDGSAEAVGVVMEVMDRIEERREKLFPDLRKIIVDYEAEFVDNRFTLNVTSAAVPHLG